MAYGVWKGVCPYIFERSLQLLLNQLFDLNTPSMRKGCDGEKKKKKNMDAQEGCILYMWGYMLFRGVISVQRGICCSRWLKGV